MRIVYGISGYGILVYFIQGYWDILDFDLGYGIFTHPFGIELKALEQIKCFGNWGTQFLNKCLYMFIFLIPQGLLLVLMEDACAALQHY